MPVGLRPRVIASEPVAGGTHLEDEGTDEQQPQEQVQPDERADLDDRDAQYGQQHDQDQSGPGGELLVAPGAAAGERAWPAGMGSACAEPHVELAWRAHETGLSSALFR